MIIANFDHEFGPHGLPLRRAAGRPSAWTARRVAGEPGRGDELLKLERQRFLGAAGDRGGEADVMQKTVIAVETEQQRADDRLTLVVAEAADHTIRAAVVLDLLHSGTIA